MDAVAEGDLADGSLLARAESAHRALSSDPTSAEFATVAADLVVLARRRRAPEALVVLLQAQAYAQRSVDASDRAKVLLDRAARVARRHGLDRQLVKVLLDRSAAYQELGRTVAAQHDLETVRPLLQAPELSDFYLQQAALFHNTGRFAAAAQMYELILADRTASTRLKAMSANNLSLIEVMLGDLFAAARHVEMATDLATTCGVPIRAAVATNRSWVAMQAGRLTESLAQFEEAGALHVAGGLPLASHYLSYVDALIQLRLLPEARATADRALEELQANRFPLVAAEGQVRRARLALLSDDAATAITAATIAAQLFSRQHRAEGSAQAAVMLVQAEVQTGSASAASVARVARAAAAFEDLNFDAKAVEAHLVAGRAAMAIGRDGTAATHLRQAQALAGSATPVLVRLNGNVAGALENLLAGRDAAVLQHCRTGLSDLGRYRNTFASLELRVLASGHGAELGQLGLGVLLRSGTPSQVFRWLERTRAAALIAVQPISNNDVDDELAELRLVQQQLSAAATEAGDGNLPDASLMGRQNAIEQRIRRATWTRRLDAGAVNAIPSASSLRARLDGRTLVEFGVLDGQLFAAVLERHRTRVVRLGAGGQFESGGQGGPGGQELTQRHVDLLLFALRRLTQPGRSEAGLLAARAGADASLLALRRLLFDDLMLPPDVPLVIVPTPALQRVPWSALRSAPVTVAPSASFWAQTDSRPAPTGPVVLVAGPELPGAQQEVLNLQLLHAAPTVLLPPASTVGAVTSALAGAALAHLACHGHLRSDNPSFSALQLSDGSLTVHELEVRGIAPHRMVLASCNSAADMGYAGDELLGFVSALMARGTAGLVASVVNIPDAGAVPLMRNLHRRILAGDRLGDALFFARGLVDPQDPTDFVAWCGFNTYGAA